MANGENLINLPPLLVIVGPTASGKSALAMQLAQNFKGEIICADSQTIRKGMNIGTAKPSDQDRLQIRHHLLDMIEPYDSFSVSDFKKLASAAIDDINQRGNLPILVGGTGLYIDSILFDYTFRSKADPGQRIELEKLSIKELQQKVMDYGLVMPNNMHNPRHLIRTIETAGQQSYKNSLRGNTLILGLQPNRDVLKARINDRVETIFAKGFVAEVISLLAQYGKPPNTFDAIGYKIVLEHINSGGILDEAVAKQDLKTAHYQYARRQITWLKRNAHVHWLHIWADADALVTTFLNKNK